VRCYGAHLNLMLARRIKRSIGIPYVVSLHINPEINIHQEGAGFKESFVNGRLAALEKKGLRDADLIMPVYEPIVPYLKQRNLTRYDVHYNMVQHEESQVKKTYELHQPVRILSVGRQFYDKDPSFLMRAVARRGDAQLTIIGKGPLHQELMSLAREIGHENQFIFIESVHNQELCAAMPTYDILALHTEYFELSKVMIEGMLAGLPLIVNFRKIGAQVPELTDDICLRVVNTADGYAAGLDRLISDYAFRRKLGENASRHALNNWSLQKTEQKYRETYLRLIQEHGCV